MQHVPPVYHLFILAADNVTSDPASLSSVQHNAELIYQDIKAMEKTITHARWL